MKKLLLALLLVCLPAKAAVSVQMFPVLTNLLAYPITSDNSRLFGLLLSRTSGITNDGTGGLFYYDTNKTGPGDGTNTFKPNLFGGLWTRVEEPVFITTNIFGVLVVTNGGTGTNLFPANGVLYGNNSAPLLSTAQGGANSILAANGGAPFFTGFPAITNLSVLGTNLTGYLIVTNYAQLLSSLYVAATNFANHLYVTNTAVFSTNVYIDGTNFVNYLIATNIITLTNIYSSGTNFVGGLVASNLTPNQVVFPDAARLLTGDTDLTFTNDTLYSTKLVAATSVGVGTQTPSRMLAIENTVSADTVALIKNTLGQDNRSVGYFATVRNTAGTYSTVSIEANAKTAAVADLYLRTGGGDDAFGTTRVVITGVDGNVGINSLTPGATLSVNGGVSIGDDTNPGNNNLRVTGTIQALGNTYSSTTGFATDFLATNSLTSIINTYVRATNHANWSIVTNTLSAGGITVATNLNVGGTNFVNYLYATNFTFPSAQNLSVGSGVSITAGTGTGAVLQALTLAVNQTFSPTWTGTHQFTLNSYQSQTNFVNYLKSTNYVEAASVFATGSLFGSKATITNQLASGTLEVTSVATAQTVYGNALYGNVITSSNNVIVMEDIQLTGTNFAGGLLASNITASRAIVSHANGTLTNSVTSDVEISYVDGVTSSIQTQLDSKVTGTAATLTAGTGTSISSGTGVGAVLQALTIIIDQAFSPTWTGTHKFSLSSFQSMTNFAAGLMATNITASRAVVSDATGVLTNSVTSAAEIAFVDGVTSAIQTQLDGKQPNITGAITTVTNTDLTASRALISNSSGKVAVSVTSDAELAFVDGVTSSIQTQLDSKITGTAATLTAGDGVSIPAGTGTGAVLQAFTLAVDEAFSFDWTALHGWTRASAALPAWTASVSGDAVVRLLVDVTGKLRWSDGSAASDTGINRSDVGTLRVTNNISAAGNVFAGTNVYANAALITNQVAAGSAAITGVTTIGGLLQAALNVWISQTNFMAYGLITNSLTVSNLTPSKVVFTDSAEALTSTGTVGVDQGGSGAATFTKGIVVAPGGTTALTTIAGTDNYFPKWSSSYPSTTSLLYDDGTHVGVMNSNPSQFNAVWRSGGLLAFRASPATSTAQQQWITETADAATMNIGSVQFYAATQDPGYANKATIEVRAVGTTVNKRGGDMLFYIREDDKTGDPTVRMILDGETGGLTLGSTKGSGRLSVDGGVHVGGTSDPGDNNLLIDGTGDFVGSLFGRGTVFGNAVTVTNDLKVGAQSYTSGTAYAAAVFVTNQLTATTMQAANVYATTSLFGNAGTITNTLTAGVVNATTTAYTGGTNYSSIFRATNAIYNGGTNFSAGLFATNITASRMVMNDAAGVLTNISNAGAEGQVLGVSGGVYAFIDSTGATLANPTGTIGLSVVNGVSTSGTRSDGHPALSQAIAPLWTGLHGWSGALTTTAIQYSLVGAEVAARWALSAGGTITWGSGAVDTETTTTLFRASANQLRTGASFSAATNIYAGNILYANTATFTNALGYASGGTGFNTYDAGEILRGVTGGGALERLALGTSGQILKVVSGQAAWSSTPSQFLSYVDTVSHGNTNTGLDVLGTFTVPANTLVNVGDRLMVRASGEVNAGALARTLQHDVSSSTPFNVTYPAASGYNWVAQTEVLCKTTGASGAIRIHNQSTHIMTSGVGTNLFNISFNTVSSLDLTGTFVINFSGSDASGVDNAVQIHSFTVEKWTAP